MLRSQHRIAEAQLTNLFLSLHQLLCECLPQEWVALDEETQRVENLRWRGTCGAPSAAAPPAMAAVVKDWSLFVPIDGACAALVEELATSGPLKRARPRVSAAATHVYLIVVVGS